VDLTNSFGRTPILNVVQKGITARAVGIQRLRVCCTRRLGVWLDEDFDRKEEDEAEEEEEDTSDVQDEEEEEPLSCVVPVRCGSCTLVACSY